MNRYFVVADDTDNTMIGSADTLEEAKEIIKEDAAQYAEMGYNMAYSIIKGERIKFNVVPRLEFNFVEEEE